MTSIPSNFAFGSATSSYSVRDAIASYRRAQYFPNANVPSPSNISGSPDDESGIVPLDDDEEEEEEEEEEEFVQSPRENTTDDYDWDDMLPQPSTQHGAYHTRTQPHVASSSSERTPLLRTALSFSDGSRPAVAFSPPALNAVAQPSGGHPKPLRRKSSSASTKVIPHTYGGKSTYGQTLFNAIAILLGIGMLSEPLAYAYAGWIGGTLLIIFYGCITCYTAKILAHIILDDPRLRSYADIGRKAFGPMATPLTSALFCLELFALSVVLVTLYADSFHEVAPSYSADTYKILGLVVLIPTVFMPLSLLSYASMIGIFSTLSIIAVIFIDGFSKKEGPGSLWSPAETQPGIESIGALGVAFGLFMAGFSGHAVIPSLARDMVDPKEFDHMINWAFIIATFVYALIGSAGYLMFGINVSEEVSRDLLNTPGYNPFLNKAALWMLVISPLSKFALSTRPLNITLEIMLGLETTPPPMSPDQLDSKTSNVIPAHQRNQKLKRVLTVVERVAFTFLSVGVSILVPDFSSVMAFLGSFSAFMLCVIGPVCAKSALAGRLGFWDAILLIIAVVMAVWGTVAAFWSV
ncbi:hypothetical protein FIBSPDRAFT_870672 [Athelia psychrophila]|uniref:Amino acid transporter transmembrane domain-containing protein n=1 Tax=Athelia psychrophila TaxID=1759441 RepID=A0A166AXA3_9AGAM|nr:hypothetical protein FIBSPDRAFT_870672 [Fibularhizoctonia sp. CBS 109695]